MALAASWIFHIYVFATADCGVHFHCVRKWIEIASPVQTNELVCGQEVIMDSPIGGFDYVLCAIAGQGIVLFEAFYPQSMEPVWNSHELILVQFDRNFNRPIFLSSVGDFVALPYKFLNQRMGNSVN
jgi:hypothetical protein